MITNFVGHLENMSLALDFLPKDYAINILTFVRKYLKDNLHSDIVDILWKRDFRPGQILLEPIEPDSHPGRGRTQPKLISLDPSIRSAVHNQSASDQISSQDAIWTFVYRFGSAVWLSGIATSNDTKRRISAKSGGDDDTLEQGYIRLTEPVENRARSGNIPPDYLVFYEETNTIIAIPMSHEDNQAAVSGVFSIEFSSHNNMDDRTVFDDLVKLAKCLANIWCKSEVHNRVTTDSDKAIQKFQAAVQGQHVPLYGSKLGFYSRPFQRSFEPIQVQINDCLRKLAQAHAQHYDQPATGQVPEDIIREIKQSRFGIADVTAANQNVMLELGMMLGLDKKVLIIRAEETEYDPPYNVSNLSTYQYSYEGQTVVFKDPTGRQRTLDDVIKRFVAEIEDKDPSWRNLNPFAFDSADGDS